MLTGSYLFKAALKSYFPDSCTQFLQLNKSLFLRLCSDSHSCISNAVMFMHDLKNIICDYKISWCNIQSQYLHMKPLTTSGTLKTIPLDLLFTCIARTMRSPRTLTSFSWNSWKSLYYRIFHWQETSFIDLLLKAQPSKIPAEAKLG